MLHWALCFHRLYFCSAELQSAPHLVPYFHCHFISDIFSALLFFKGREVLLASSVCLVIYWFLVHAWYQSEKQRRAKKGNQRNSRVCYFVTVGVRNGSSNECLNYYNVSLPHYLFSCLHLGPGYDCFWIVSPLSKLKIASIIRSTTDLFEIPYIYFSFSIAEVFLWLWY